MNADKEDAVFAETAKRFNQLKIPLGAFSPEQGFAFMGGELIVVVVDMPGGYIAVKFLPCKVLQHLPWS